MFGVSTAADVFKPNIRPSLVVKRTSGPVRIDGHLNDPGWQGAAVASGFSQLNPRNLEKPPVRTDVLVTYDNANLYLGFVAYDDPRSLRSSLQDRDQAWQDDVVGLMLDTYGDGAWAYEIFCNPLGVQGDIRWTANNEDLSFDLVWESAAAITDSSYQVEMAIPFKSLRFPNRPEQTWRATFWRNHPRKSRGQYSWAAIDNNVPCFPCQWGILTGIKDVRPGRDIEFLPAVTGFQSGSLRDTSNVHSGLAQGRGNGRLSLGARYSLSSSATAEAAWKPDFSQVESDVAQIDVNSTFALFYPEHRPFFQEGADLFETPIQAVYTRTINDPLVAAKVVGRSGRTSLAYVGAHDRQSPIAVPLEERGDIVAGGKSISSILRLKRTYSEDSFIGGLLTTRSLDGGGSGTLFGVDGSQRFLRNYRIKYQALLSRTAESRDTSLTSGIDQTYFDNGHHTVVFDGEKYWGRGVFASFIRDARLWNFNIDYLEKSPTFRAANGFEVQNDIRQALAWTGLFFRPNTAFLDQFVPNINMARVWNFNGLRKDEWIVPEISMLFKAQTVIEFQYLWIRERFRAIDFPGIRRFQGEVQSNFSNPLTFYFSLEKGRFIARNLDVPVLGNGLNLTFSATVKPWSRFIIQPEYAYSKLNYPDGGPKIFEGYILRSRFNYQFTREMSLRLITQFDHFNKEFSVEPLLSYRINPFTIFYIGSTQGFEKFDSEKGLIQTSTQYFLKFQYLISI